MRTSEKSMLGAAIGALGVSALVLVNKLTEGQKRKQIEKDEAVQLRAIQKGLETLKKNCQADLSSAQLGRIKIDKDFPDRIAHGEIFLYADDRKETPLNRISDKFANAEAFEEIVAPIADMCNSNEAWLDVILEDGVDGHASIKYEFLRVTDESRKQIDDMLGITTAAVQVVTPALMAPAAE